MLKEATTNQHWLAVDHDYYDEAASVGRSVSDGVLFKIEVNISGSGVYAREARKRVDSFLVRFDSSAAKRLRGTRPIATPRIGSFKLVCVGSMRQLVAVRCMFEAERRGTDNTLG